MTTASRHVPDRLQRRLKRGVGVAGGVVAAVAVWAVTVGVLGVDLHVTPGTEQPQPVGVGSVVVASLVAGLAGWGLLEVLERSTSRARPVWLGSAVVALVVSMGGPLAGEDLGVTAALAAMHLAVAAVVIPVLFSTLERRRHDRVQ